MRNKLPPPPPTDYLYSDDALGFAAALFRALSAEDRALILQDMKQLRLLAELPPNAVSRRAAGAR